jgi:hypothetical protein
MLDITQTTKTAETSNLDIAVSPDKNPLPYTTFRELGLIGLRGRKNGKYQPHNTHRRSHEPWGAVSIVHTTASSGWHKKPPVRTPSLKQTQVRVEQTVRLFHLKPKLELMNETTNS